MSSPPNNQLARKVSGSPDEQDTFPRPSNYPVTYHHTVTSEDGTSQPSMRNYGQRQPDNWQNIRSSPKPHVAYGDPRSSEYGQIIPSAMTKRRALDKEVEEAVKGKRHKIRSSGSSDSKAFEQSVDAWLFYRVKNVPFTWDSHFREMLEMGGASETYIASEDGVTARLNDKVQQRDKWLRLALLEVKRRVALTVRRTFHEDGNSVLQLGTSWCRDSFVPVFATLDYIVIRGDMDINDIWSDIAQVVERTGLTWSVMAVIVDDSGLLPNTAAALKPWCSWLGEIKSKSYNPYSVDIERRCAYTTSFSDVLDDTAKKFLRDVITHKGSHWIYNADSTDTIGASSSPVRTEGQLARLLVADDPLADPYLQLCNCKEGVQPCGTLSELLSWKACVEDFEVLIDHHQWNHHERFAVYGYHHDSDVSATEMTRLKRVTKLMRSLMDYHDELCKRRVSVAISDVMADTLCKELMRLKESFAKDLGSEGRFHYALDGAIKSISTYMDRFWDDPVLRLSAVLDPRLKQKRLIERFGADTTAMVDLKQNIRDRYASDVSTDGGTYAGHAQMTFDQRLLRRYAKPALKGSHDDVEEYFSTGPIEFDAVSLKDDLVADWWARHEPEYPLMAFAARDFFSIQASVPPGIESNIQGSVTDEWWEHKRASAKLCDDRKDDRWTKRSE